MLTTTNDHSRPGLDPASARVAVVAGSGSLPADVVRALAAMGHRPMVVGIEGECELGEEPGSYAFSTITIERLGTVVRMLRREGITHLVLAGGVARRPRLSRLRLSFDVVRRLPQIMRVLASGDDALLRAIIGHAEANGIRVVGAHEIVPDLVTPPGVLTVRRPSRADRKDVAAGEAAARAIGGLDIGQAAVAIGGRVVALEGIEGTDGLLARTVELRRHGRLAGKAGGVLVKCAKPGQEMRADLPAIGPDTIDAAHAAGLAGVALDAGRSFILDHGVTIARADALGLFVLGLEDGQ